MREPSASSTTRRGKSLLDEGSPPESRCMSEIAVGQKVVGGDRRCRGRLRSVLQAASRRRVRLPHRPYSQLAERFRSGRRGLRCRVLRMGDLRPARRDCGEWLSRIADRKLDASVAAGAGHAPLNINVDLIARSASAVVLESAHRASPRCGRTLIASPSRNGERSLPLQASPPQERGLDQQADGVGDPGSPNNEVASAVRKTCGSPDFPKNVSSGRRPRAAPDWEASSSSRSGRPSTTSRDAAERCKWWRCRRPPSPLLTSDTEVSMFR